MKKLLAGLLAVPTALAAALPQAQAATTVVSAEGLVQRSGKSGEAFQGEFCDVHECTSVNNIPTSVERSRQQLDAGVRQALANDPTGKVITLSWSLGGAATTEMVIDWLEDPENAPDPDRVFFITFGSPYNAVGGSQRNEDRDLPPVVTYQGLEVISQYDSVADTPDRRGWYSRMNLTFARHDAYFPADINDPKHRVWTDENGVTYMLIEADVLPMLKWRDWFTSDERMAELDAKYRPLIEADYDRDGNGIFGEEDQNQHFVEQGDGADWVNGNPPPSLTEEDDDVEAEDTADGAEGSLEGVSADRQRSDANRRGKAGGGKDAVAGDADQDVVVDGDEEGDVSGEDEASEADGDSPEEGGTVNVDSDADGDDGGSDSDE